MTRHQSTACIDMTTTIRLTLPVPAIAVANLLYSFSKLEILSFCSCITSHNLSSNALSKFVCTTPSRLILLPFRCVICMKESAVGESV